MIKSSIRAQRRDELKAHLGEQGIGSGIYYPLPLHLQPCFEHLGYGEGDFPEAERASAEVLSLPVFPELRSEEQGSVRSAIETFYGS
jgi:dTDP-4-amino-4,6-dideoxygalactose transaminase